MSAPGRPQSWPTDDARPELGVLRVTREEGRQMPKRTGIRLTPVVFGDYVGRW